MVRTGFRLRLLALMQLALCLCQLPHIVHGQVICRDAAGLRIECADLMGRCHCLEESVHPSVWSFSASRGSGLIASQPSCRDTTIAPERPLSPSGLSVQTGPTMSTPVLAVSVLNRRQSFRPIECFGPSPPSRTPLLSLLSSRRC